MKEQYRNRFMTVFSVCLTAISFYIMYQGVVYLNKQMLGIFDLEQRVDRLERKNETGKVE